jgi:hypothetical protein
MEKKFNIGQKVIIIFHLFDEIQLNTCVIKSYSYSSEKGWYYSIQQGGSYRSGIKEDELFLSKEDFLNQWNKGLKHKYIEKAKNDCISTLKHHKDNLEYARKAILTNEKRLGNINNENFKFI